MAHKPTPPFLYTEAELRQQFKDAVQRGTEADRQDLRAVAASYDKRTKRLMIELANGVLVQIPASLVQGLAAASPQELATVTLSPQGTVLHWDTLDADFSVSGLLAGVFGTRAWMVEVGRKGGQAKSTAKAAAARINGQKGGRPLLRQRPTVRDTLPRLQPRPEARTVR